MQSLPNSNQVAYRQDVDGLRAVAVLSVIVFHINETLLPGGFVGVDIFFVISGYLISLHIFQDLEKRRFSLVEFYRRRIKRIIPAMLAVVLVTVVAAQFLFRPSDAEVVAESGLWSLLSMANVYFWLFQDTSYFAAASNEKPLLHLWSLGVEEQFYMLWPLLLLFTHKLGHGKIFFTIISLVVIASFIAGDYLFPYDPSFAYYMLPTRAGELLIGALIAQFLMKRGAMQISRVVVTSAAYAGVAMIFAAMFWLTPHDVFPGVRAILPTAGVALLIFSGHFGESLPTRLLKLRPMILVGLISYSAYLWHWPLLAFYRYGYAEVTLVPGIIIFALTMLLAWLSYRFIETPFRYSKRGALSIFVRQFLVPSGAIAVIALVAMKIDGYGIRWFSDNYKAELAEIRDATKPAYKFDYVCQKQLITDAVVNKDSCIVGSNEETASPSVLLWGDSNAAHYIGVLGAFAKKEGFSFRNLQIGSCPPINADAKEFVEARRASDCERSRAITMAAVQKHDIVIISANWTFYQERSARFLDVFYDTVRSLTAAGKNVVLIGKAPVIDSYDRLCREKGISFPLVNCDVEDAIFPKNVADINAQLSLFAVQEDSVEYLDFNNYLCPNGICSAYDEDGLLVYFDSSHLALPASWRLGHQILETDGTPYPFNRMSTWNQGFKTASFGDHIID